MGITVTAKNIIKYYVRVKIFLEEKFLYMYGYVILTDIEKYSSLKDADLKIYYNRIIPIIFEELKNYKDSAIIWNTWGDAIFAIYDKAETAINMALAYRDAFNKLDFNQFGIKKLNPRIAGNFGEFELIFDPVSGKSNVHGTLVNLTARIEPVTSPGEIFVTKNLRIWLFQVTIKLIM